MGNTLRNWQSTLFGVGSVISGVALYFQGNTTEGIAAILAGIGLIVSKDANKTGILP